MLMLLCGGVDDFYILTSGINTVCVFAVVVAVGETGWVFAGSCWKGCLDEKFGCTAQTDPTMR